MKMTDRQKQRRVFHVNMLCKWHLLMAVSVFALGYQLHSDVEGCSESTAWWASMPCTNGRNAETIARVLPAAIPAVSPSDCYHQSYAGSAAALSIATCYSVGAQTNGKGRNH